MGKLQTKIGFLQSPKNGAIALLIKIAVLVIITILVFLQDLLIIFSDALNSSTTSYILAVPFIFTFLIYRKRRMIRATITYRAKNFTENTKNLPIIIGILLMATAIIFYWYGSYTFTPLEYHLSVLPIFIAGLTLLLFNMQTLRQLIFPIAFLILLIPPPSEILYGLGATLSIISSEVSFAIINLLGVPSTLSSEYGNPAIIITRPNGITMPFSVDVACSGVYSLIGFLSFSIFIAYIIRDKHWKKMTIFLIGFPLIYMFNIIRITSILLIGYNFGEDIALQIFHLLGGWILIFIGTILLLVLAEKLFKLQIFRKNKQCENCKTVNEKLHNFCIECGRIIKTKYLKLSRNDIVKITTLAISIILIVSIQAPVFALTRISEVVMIDSSPEQHPSTNILPQIEGYELDFIYRDTRFEEIAQQDMSLAYLYTPIDQQNIPIWVTIEIAPSKYQLHSWEYCLISWYTTKGDQPKVRQIELQDVPIIDNPPIFGRYFLFQYPATNLTQAVLYWYETATFTVNSSQQQKHAKISIITYPENGENLTFLQNELHKSATAIANYWEPIKTWSTLALFLSINGDKLAIIPITLLVIIAIYYIYNSKREKRKNSHTFAKLSKLNRQLITITYETQKNDIPTLENISIEYKKITGKTIDKIKLLNNLNLIEKTGILKRKIINRNDEPIIAWKTQLDLK